MFSLAAGLALSLIGAESRAGSFTLAQLIGGPTTSFTVDGLTFANFSYSATAGMPTASNVNVIFPILAGGGVGIEFQALFSALPGNLEDALIRYTVTGTAINDVYMAGNPDVNGGTGLARVTETIFSGNPPSGPAIAQISIDDSAPPGSLTGHAFFAPQSTITVVKDIGLNGGSKGATISFIDQTFSTIPEPASVALLGIGLSGLLTFRRFFKRVSVA